MPYVDDKTNFSDAYTRNYIRINVLPALEKAVPGAAEAIFRFSRLAEEDEEFFREEINRRGIVINDGEVVFIKHSEKPLFTRAAVEAVKNVFNKKDYTSVQIETLYDLLFCENGKGSSSSGLPPIKKTEEFPLRKLRKTGWRERCLFMRICAVIQAYTGGNSSNLPKMPTVKPRLTVRKF